ncbi:MAG: sterol desaturase family protein [Bacteroidota bacterium]
MTNDTVTVLPIIMNLARYAIFAGIPFLFFYVLFPEKFSRHKIQHRLARHKDFIRELLHSLKNMVIIIGVAYLIIHSSLGGYSQIYQEVDTYPLWWIPVSALLALILHDAYFYWLHRTIHHPKLFRWAHAVHHKSTNPSPLAAYSFNLIEGFFEALIGIIVILLIPMHLSAVALFAFIGFLFNVYGHLGYEIAPRWFRHSFLFEIFNTSVHHNLHHRKFKGNYGLYFRFWDRVMGTEHPQYVQTYDRIQAQRFGEQKPQAAKWPKVVLPLLLWVSLSGFSPSGTSDIKGEWKDEEAGGIISIYEKNGRYYGKLVRALDPADQAKIAGKNIMIFRDFQATDENQYCCGTIFLPRYQKTAAGTLKMVNPSTLEVKGSYGIFSKTKILTRVGVGSG